ncbi:L-rhamnose mutarotase [Prosthecomicrobium pneumaticum]|uniref:L-rhamnose mutarotase n=1 Tax=Prosthecomicrobium pneumaticum TaxID=81895 RepID=A0A7W9FK54_9HYPH|nr:L-rhamnose mutarotase [Prosthecomicrobium pneumaticum]MBB5752291.1 L-rhamnose mutarotase [Prosthecomicrobium pneumaticum]
MRRMGMVIRVRPEKIAEYKRLHADPSPEVNALLSGCGVRNYSIYLREPENLLFGYWEYHGADWPADAARLGEEPAIRVWLAQTDPCQEKLASAGPDEWWAAMEEVFHLD